VFHVCPSAGEWRIAPFISSLSLSEGKVPDIELQQSSVCLAKESLTMNAVGSNQDLIA
jgi:hypothetical protein